LEAECDPVVDRGGEQQQNYEPGVPPAVKDHAGNDQ
jgi:hypothetical protein